MIVIEIVDHDEVEVGTRRHLAGAKPAQRDDRALAAADAAVSFGEIGFRPRVDGAQQNIG